MKEQGNLEDWQYKSEFKEKLKYIFVENKFFDCFFVFNGDRSVPAHKLILAMSSPVFEGMFFGNFKPESEVTIDDINPTEFEKIISFIYTGQAEISSVDEAYGIYNGAEKYMLPKLKVACKNFLRDSVTTENALAIFEFATFYDIEIVKNACLWMIRNHTSEVFTKEALQNVKNINTILTVLQQDSLKIDNEVDLFNIVIDYIKNVSVTDENKDEFRNIIKQIRFMNLAPKDLMKHLEDTEMPVITIILSEDEINQLLRSIMFDRETLIPNGFSKSKSKRYEKKLDILHSMSKGYQLIEDYTNTMMVINPRLVSNYVLADRYNSKVRCLDPRSLNRMSNNRCLPSFCSR